VRDDVVHINKCILFLNSHVLNAKIQVKCVSIACSTLLMIFSPPKNVALNSECAPTVCRYSVGIAYIHDEIIMDKRQP
jgi:hypothetical protein